MTMAKVIHTTATAAMGRLQRPMYHGPGWVSAMTHVYERRPTLKREPQIRREAMGMP